MAQLAAAPMFLPYEQLDELPLSRFHWRLLLVSGFGWMFDAMDVLIVGSVIAAAAAEWRLEPTQSQAVSTANLAGLFCGALASGWLSDRFGRRSYSPRRCSYTASSTAFRQPQTAWKR